MTDRKKSEGMDALMDMWKQSQDAFLKAQSDVADGFRKSLNEMAGTSEPAGSDPLAAWQALIKAWSPTWDWKPASPVGGAGYDFRHGQQAFFEMLEPQRWTTYAPEQLRVMLEQIASGPQFADLAMPQQQAAQAWRETLDYQDAASAMSKVMQDAWTRAYREYSKEYTLEDLKSGNVNDALQAWLNAANLSLLEAQSSSEFLEAQKKMVRASTEIRARQRDMAEDWSEAWQIPTRTEIDDLTRIVHQLRREVRELRRELNSLKNG